MEYIYGVLLLHKLGHPVNEENLKKVIHATGSSVDETKVKSLIASLHGVDITLELANASTLSAAPAEAKTEKKEEKKEEKVSESAAGLSALFG